jgi:IMP dehydrogenase/GMP reductase
MEQNINKSSETLPGKLVAVGLAFDDVLIAPHYSAVVPSEVAANTRLTVAPSVASPEKPLAS